MRNAYHDELDALNDSMVEMARLVGSAIDRATQALLDADVQVAEAVISADQAIDDHYNDINERALDLLARQQPVARDLRILITSLRIIADLERMGDMAEHIAKVARRRYPAQTVPAELRATVREMGDVSEQIVTKAANVIATRDLALAVELEKDDDVMDALHRKLFAMLLDPQWQGAIEAAIDVTLCSRYYERFCDHAVSVARRVMFLVTGERYQPESATTS